MKQTLIGICTCMAISAILLGAEEVYRIDRYLNVAGEKAGCFFTREGTDEDFLPQHMPMITNIYGMETIEGVLSNLTVCAPQYTIITNTAIQNVFHLISTNLPHGRGKGMDEVVNFEYSGHPAGMWRSQRLMIEQGQVESLVMVDMSLNSMIQPDGSSWNWTLDIAATNMIWRDVLTNYLPIDDTWVPTLWNAIGFVGISNRIGFAVMYGGKRIQQQAADDE